MNTMRFIKSITSSLLTTVILFSMPVSAVPLDLATKPLFVSSTVAPLAMLVMGRDHKLYYEAYNDASDLNGDGVIDVGYKPDDIEYFGYFDSYRCYSYSGNRFSPEGATTTKRCNGVSGSWSGDFLNYITTARIDALRKVLYGGYRSIDTDTLTVLQRTHIPQDAHAWGKEYDPLKDTGYSISDYTSLSEPTSGKRHIFANVTLLSYDDEPLMRVLNDTEFRVWDWVSKEQPIAGNTCSILTNVGSTSTTNCQVGGSIITDYSVNVEVCQAGKVDGGCKQYPNGNYKPTGVLQKYGENDSMMFGLLSGSYRNNLQGGVLRKQISSLTDEINSNDGTFTSVVGIVKTIDRLRIIGFDYNSRNGKKQYDVIVDTFTCHWVYNYPDRDPLNPRGEPNNFTLENGECNMWGNPIAEMMYESLRYFSGAKSPLPDFDYGPEMYEERDLQLPKADWNDPYDTSDGGYPYCAKPFQLVISDINPSYDSDQVPGTSFSGGYPADPALPGLNVTALGDKITAGEGDIVGLHYIGESGAVSDSAPTPKQVTSLGTIRGLSPEEPTKEGSYYSASVAHYGWLSDISDTTSEPASEQGNKNSRYKQRVNTFSIALASPIPTIRIPVSNGREVTLVPFGKTPGVIEKNALQTVNSPLTNQIVDFYVEDLSENSGSFLINFEDMEQGADHDMDALVRYSYKKMGNDLIEIKVDSLFASGGFVQHLGYVISGTTRDGVYLEVRDRKDNESENDMEYTLDTPAGVWAGDDRSGQGDLEYSSTRTFTASGSAAATLLKNPLWYAAKWGGFTDSGAMDGTPDIQSEWDEDGDGNPDNYFLVTNALTLEDQLGEAFDEILSRNGSSATVTVNSGSLGTNSMLYQAIFSTENWTGAVRALPIESDGSVNVANETWDSKEVIKTQLSTPGNQAAVDNRVVLTFNSADKTGIPFVWPSNYLSPSNAEMAPADSSALLSGVSSAQQAYGEDLVDYIRGRDNNEGASSVRQFRERDGYVLGDIVHSDPVYVPEPGFFYPDIWESIGLATVPENSLAAQKYSAFRALLSNRAPVLYFGANDGMFHGIDASSTGGNEVLAYVPTSVYGNLAQLTRPSYSHRYYVDGPAVSGDVFFSSDNLWHTTIVGSLRGGGQGVFALDITDPEGITSSYPSFSETNADEVVLWEFTDADDVDLGNTFGKASVVRMANGKWAAIFGNGYNNTDGDGRISSTGNAAIFIVDIETGRLIRKLETLTGTADDPTPAGRPNGISEPAPVDVNGDGIIDYIYAGDLFGNVWLFDVTSNSAFAWESFYGSTTNPAPFYIAKNASGDALPITTRVQVSSHPKFRTGHNYMVYFGTGKYIENSDNDGTNQLTQTFHGLWDNGTVITNRSSLLQQTIEPQLVAGSEIYRQVSDNAIDWISTTPDRGWYMDLIGSGSANNYGERQITNAVIRNGRLIFTTLVPSTDVCSAGGSGWLMLLNAANGGATNALRVDTDGDGDVDDTDAPIGGIQPGGLDAGIPSMPAIMDLVEGSSEVMILGTSIASIVTIEAEGSQNVNRISWREVR